MENKEFELSSTRFMLLVIARIALMIFALLYYIRPWFEQAALDMNENGSPLTPIVILLFATVGVLVLTGVVIAIILKVFRFIGGSFRGKMYEEKLPYKKNRLSFTMGRFGLFNLIIYFFAICLCLVTWTSLPNKFPLLFLGINPLYITILYILLNRRLIVEMHKYFYPLFKAEMERKIDSRPILEQKFEVLEKKAYVSHVKSSGDRRRNANVYFVENILKYKKLPIYVELQWTTDQKYDKWHVFGSREFLTGPSR